MYTIPLQAFFRIFKSDGYILLDDLKADFFALDRTIISITAIDIIIQTL